MSEQLRLYLRLVGAQMRSAMQYRVSLLAETIGMFLVTALDFIAMVILLTRFRSIGNWTLGEVAFLYGTSAISYGLAEMVSGYFASFDILIVRGEFDRLLIRPLGLVFQMAAGDFPLRRVGRVAQGAIALAIALSLVHPIWNGVQWLFLLVTIGGGMLFFMAIFVISASVAFWTPQTAELTNIFSNGGQFMASYPLHIYQQWMQAVFTFLIPTAFVNYYPSLFLLDKPDPLGLPNWMPFLSPLVAVIAFSVALLIWNEGVRHYQSTGS